MSCRLSPSGALTASLALMASPPRLRTLRGAARSAADHVEVTLDPRRSRHPDRPVREAPADPRDAPIAVVVLGPQVEVGSVVEAMPRVQVDDAARLVGRVQPDVH